MCDACDAGIGDDPVRWIHWIDQQTAWMRDTVRRKGWFVQHVEADASGPAFAYTVGLTGFGHPELVVFGMGVCCAGPVLNELGDRVRAGAPVLHDGDEVTIRGVPMRAFTVPNPGELILVANLFYGRGPEESVPALQLAHPDRSGNWPWEPEYAHPLAQPMPGTVRA
jgi:hypothetical protein